MEHGGDPTTGRPWMARPWAVIAWGAMAYFVVTAGPAAILLIKAVDEGIEPIIAWGMLCLSFALPVGLALGALAAGRERLVVGVPLVGRHLWAGYSVGAVLASHWLVLLGWTPLALGYAVGVPYSREEYLRSALAGLIPWGAVIAGVAVIAATRWAFRSRGLEESETARQLPELPHVVGAGAVAALLVGPPMLVGGIVVAERGDGGGMGIPVVAVLAGVGIVAGTALSWSCAAAEAEGARNGRRPVSWSAAFASTLGVFLIVQWGALLMPTLLPAWNDALGQRFVLQLAVIAGVSLGAGLAGRRLAGLEVGTVRG